MCDVITIHTFLCFMETMSLLKKVWWFIENFIAQQTAIIPKTLDIDRQVLNHTGFEEDTQYVK